MYAYAAVMLGVVLVSYPSFAQENEAENATQNQASCFEGSLNTSFAVEAKIQERKTAILAENKEAASLSVEIVGLEKALSEKQAALNAIFNADEEYVGLEKQVKEGRVSVRTKRLELGRQIAENIRQRNAEADAKRRNETEVNKTNNAE